MTYDRSRVDRWLDAPPLPPYAQFSGSDNWLDQDDDLLDCHMRVIVVVLRVLKHGFSDSSVAELDLRFLRLV